MPEKPLFVVHWTENAFENVSEIKIYLKTNFTDKEVNRFYDLLYTFESVVSLFPKIYPQTNKHLNVHKAVLNKYLSVFYRVLNSKIQVLAVLDNRNNLNNWL